MSSSYESTDQYLEIAFRILRTDATAQFAAGIRALSEGKTVTERDLRLYQSLKVIACRTSGGAVQAIVSFVARSKRRDLSDRLMQGNLICISMSGAFTESALIWGVVAAGSSQLLEENAVLIELLYEADNEQAGLHTLEALIAVRVDTARMVESPVYFESVRYALEHLQSLGREQSFQGPLQSASVLPFFDVLVRHSSQNNVAPGYLRQGETLGANLDESQRDALIRAKSQRVACVQGTSAPLAARVPLTAGTFSH